MTSRQGTGADHHKARDATRLQTPVARQQARPDLLRRHGYPCEVRAAQRRLQALLSDAPGPAPAR
ncbi:hypothetical protein [Falsiroseomonas selenitidurans]|uniref:Uncharacterized protein n=1 Tax=Falsiroseomonas selenitidurans TaxID=2716335 RepID=A0ABX1E452_9PROT|nr:hypothetical protein [Falsiroseomonas selenitidurans]NKC31558.1 hypothetical protein [Falsiroseomonas selenitidurans]